MGSEPGPPHCLEHPTPHGQPHPPCHSRDRDYDDIDDDDPFNPQARRIAAHNPSRGQLRSFCSYSSGLGSQTSLQPPAQTISNAPVSEYMYGMAPQVAPPTTPPRHIRLGRPRFPSLVLRSWICRQHDWSREPGGEEEIQA